MKGWPSVPLGQVAKQRKEFVTIDDFKRYKRCRVQLHRQGIVLRDEVDGIEIKTKRQQVCRAGELLVAEIDAKVGGYGIVPPDLDGALVSSHYFLYEIDEAKISIPFLAYALKTETFFEQVQAQGSTNYAAIRSEDALRYEIPLPPLPTQRRIADFLNGIRERSLAAFAIEEQRTEAVKGMLRGAFRKTLEKAKWFPVSEIAPVVRRPVEVMSTEIYPELGVRSFGRGTFHKPPISAIDLGDKRIFWIHPGDLIFMNVFAWEGAIAVAGEIDRGRVGSHRFITCVPDRSRAMAEYLNYFFLTNEGLAVLGAASPGGAGRNRTLGIEALLRTRVPVPPLSLQKWFCDIGSRTRRVLYESQAGAELRSVLVDAVARGALENGTRMAIAS